MSLETKRHLKSELCTEFTAEKLSECRQKKVQFYNLIDRDAFCFRGPVLQV